MIFPANCASFCAHRLVFAQKNLAFSSLMRQKKAQNPGIVDEILGLMENPNID
jgi:hypothetical protein